jgi:uncharacterized protein
VPDARDAAGDEQALPRYGNRPLPAQRHLPGRTPRPRACEAVPRPLALRFEPGSWWTCADFLHGIDLWNRRFFWEAHEAWEEPWRAAGRDPPVGRILQGLILLAAGALKHELGADGPARRLAARGARLVREARAPQPGFDAPAFAAAVEAWVSAARAAPPLLRLDLSRGAASGADDACGPSPSGGR